MPGFQSGDPEMSGRYRVGHDDYRDDRKFVMNLEPCGGGEWLLTTYRNTGSLPPVRQDRFASREEAVAYVRKWEPTVPVIVEVSTELNADGTRTDEEVLPIMSCGSMSKVCSVSCP